MGRTQGPHTRNPRSAPFHRGSKKRVASLSAFAPVPVDFWLFMAVGLIMLGVCAVILYLAM